MLTKLNWDVSTVTALDFLDQVSARYTSLQHLNVACRNAVHRIQLGTFIENFYHLLHKFL